MKPVPTRCVPAGQNGTKGNALPVRPGVRLIAMTRAEDRRFELRMGSLPNRISSVLHYSPRCDGMRRTDANELVREFLIYRDATGLAGMSRD
jgi:hypothetical protein